MIGDAVFIGGATVGLWRTDPAARPPRLTVDVDVTAEVFTLGAYERFQAALRAHGFAQDIDSDVICRWHHVDRGVVLDAVPADARLAGMRGRWLADAAAAAVSHTLPSGETIRVVQPAWLLALKLEAFSDRGTDDVMGSRDFEDIALLVDGREELNTEVTALRDDVRAFISDEIARTMRLPNIDYGVEAALAGPGGRERALAITIPRL